MRSGLFRSVRICIACDTGGGTEPGSDWRRLEGVQASPKPPAAAAKARSATDAAKARLRRASKWGGGLSGRLAGLVGHAAGTVAEPIVAPATTTPSLSLQPEPQPSLVQSNPIATRPTAQSAQPARRKWATPIEAVSPVPSFSMTMSQVRSSASASVITPWMESRSPAISDWRKVIDSPRRSQSGR